ncbi:TetR/AcrR family transcriptional regulator [Flexibacterium corallicola]|uniref:TetR/AcrR family transcriptional regulator n=1 Tax=Flexibacterium corallicola TaxID=3037259 RepID=UPI00286F346F|nr:TetR/AcrR family transcriptional regulator [Pseudovibrio sp. M1P-2-3]
MKQKTDLKRQKGMATRKLLIESTINSLDKRGYSETSINRVLEGVDVSRGALMHHFPTKEDLIISTIDFLLSRILRKSEPRKIIAPPQENDTGKLPDLLITYWRKIVDTPEGRAFSEIILASRTDSNLAQRIEDKLARWDQELGQFFVPENMEGTDQEDQMVIVSTILRSFIRGLILQQQFGNSPQFIESMIRTFAKLLEPQLDLRHISTYLSKP